MLASAARSHIHSSSHRLTHSLLFNSSSASSSARSNIRQYNQTVQPQLNPFASNLPSWKLTHQPHEPNLHWNSRFRPLTERQRFDLDDDASTDNWDSWFRQNPVVAVLSLSQQTNSFSSDQLYFLDLPSPTPMSKHSRHSSTEISNKREKYDHVDWKLPKRFWSNTNYDQRLSTSHHEHFQFHLISYNILAQRLIEDNPFLYDDCSENHLDWNHRKHRLFREILKQNADIICLQEMQQEHYQHDFRPKMIDYGYDSIYIKRSGDKLDGCCLFYKVDRLRLITHRTVPFYKRNIQLLDRDNCGLIALFQPLTSNSTSTDLFCVATTHLLFSPKRGDIKLAQIQYFLAEIDQFSLKDANFNTYYPIIICGDFNAQPQSPISKFLINGHIKYDAYRRIEISGQIPSSMVNNRFSLPLPSNELLPLSFVTSDCRFPPSRTTTTNDDQSILRSYITRIPSARLTHNKQFHSVYDLDDPSKVTTRIENESNQVDYIFYTQQTNDPYRLNLSSRYDLYDQNQMFNIHLPNHQFASDHFLLAAKFALKLVKRK